MELYTMPCSMFQILYRIAFEKQKSEEGKKQLENEAQEEILEDVIEEGGLIP